MKTMPGYHNIVCSIDAPSSMAKYVHPNIVVKIKSESFSVPAWHGLYKYEANALQHIRFPQCTINKAHK